MPSLNDRSQHILVAKFVLALAAGGSVLGANAETSRGDYGTYNCRAHRVVGIQGDQIWGEIDLPEEKRAFVIHIQQITAEEKSDAERLYCANLSALKRDQPLSVPEYDVWWHCRTSSRLTFSQGKSQRELRGDGGWTVVGQTFNDSLRGYFHIKGQRYWYAYQELPLEYYYLEEGECMRK
jgi:hypothetical protein